MIRLILNPGIPSKVGEFYRVRWCRVTNEGVGSCIHWHNGMRLICGGAPIVPNQLVEHAAADRCGALEPSTRFGALPAWREYLG